MLHPWCEHACRVTVPRALRACVTERALLPAMEQDLVAAVILACPAPDAAQAWRDRGCLGDGLQAIQWRQVKSGTHNPAPDISGNEQGGPRAGRLHFCLLREKRGKGSKMEREIGHRPWGRYEVLLDDPQVKVKRIVVESGARLSLQRHHHRDEHWFVVAGRATVTLDLEERTLLPGEAVDIPRLTWHRVLNEGSAALTFIEVQTGDSFSEEDIERREDDYGRA